MARARSGFAALSLVWNRRNNGSGACDRPATALSAHLVLGCGAVLRFLAVTTLAVALSGCLDVCTRAENLNKNFQTRHEKCFPSGTLPNAPFDPDRCDTSMKVCSKTDEETIHTYFDCLERLPVCTQETKAAFNDKFLACANTMTTVSAGCFVP